jgi:hypothetical protein
VQHGHLQGWGQGSRISCEHNQGSGSRIKKKDQNIII